MKPDIGNNLPTILFASYSSLFFFVNYLKQNFHLEEDLGIVYSANTVLSNFIN